MSTVIVPGQAGTSPTVVTDDDDKRRGHDHGADRRIERQIAEVEARSLVETAKNAAASILESAKNAAATQIQEAKDAAATQILVQTKADALTLSASQNTATTNALVNQRFAETDAAMAECCCEIKSLVKEDGEKTRDLVSSIQASNLAVDLVDAKTEIAFLKTRVPSGTVV